MIRHSDVSDVNVWRRRLIDGSALVALLGLVFVVGGVVLWVTELAPAAPSPTQSLYELAMHVGFGVVVLGLGVHVERSDLPPEEAFSVLAWCYGGFGLMALLSVWGHLGVVLAGELTVAFVSDFVVYTSLGGAFGVVAGVNDGRSRRNRQLAERNEAQRETLALLTRLVSHDVRNDMAVVKGYADLLAETADEDDAATVEVIRSHVDTTIQLLEDAGTLVEALDEDREFEPIDLSAVLCAEVRSLQDAHPDVDVETAIPPGLTVTADALCHQLFGNLLGNAVAHNDAAALTVSVSAERDGAWMEVVVADDGTGIPEGVREQLFELGERGAGSEGDGIGLYLVSRLAEIYGGDVDYEDAPGGGARFRVRLPATGGDQPDPDGVSVSTDPGEATDRTGLAGTSAQSEAAANGGDATTDRD